MSICNKLGNLGKFGKLNLKSLFWCPFFLVLFIFNHESKSADSGYDCAVEQLDFHISRLRSFSLYGQVDKTDYERAKNHLAFLRGKVSLSKERREQLLIEEKLIEGYNAVGSQTSTNPADCGGVDLRSKMGPIRDQDTVGWCHAFTAADLLSAKLGRRISAASLGVVAERAGLSEANKPIAESKILHGGRVDTTLVAGLKKGSCLEADFPSEYFGNGDIERRTLIDIIKKAENEADLASGSEPFYLKPYDFESPLLVCNQTTSGNLFSMQQMQTLKNIKSAVMGKSRSETVFSDMERKACDGKRINQQAISVRSYSIMEFLEFPHTQRHTNEKELLSKIDEQLSKGIPLGMSYYSRFLLTKTVEKKDAHASIIVGRAFNSASGQCEYLVRNSWGKGCAGMPEPEFRCKDGHFWISKGELHRHILGVTYLE